MVTVDCGDFFSTVKGRKFCDECQDNFYEELYDGAMLEADNFIKLFIHELAETLGGKCMDNTDTNGLSANSQQAKNFYYNSLYLQSLRGFLLCPE